MVPRICKTILAKSQKRHPMLCLPLLLAGIPMSTYLMGESVSQKAMVGIFPRAASLMGCNQKETKCPSFTKLISLELERKKDLVIGSGISEDKETRLVEWSLKLIGESTGSMPSGNSMSTRVLSELQNSSLTVRPCRLYNHVLRVLNPNNHSRCQLKLFPSFTEVDYVNSYPYITNTITTCLLLLFVSYALILW